MLNENINGQELYDTDFDSLDDDSRSGYTGPPEPIRKTCGRCGQPNLIWKNFDGKWKLAECSISGPHQCNNETTKP